MKKTLLYALGIMLLAACSDNDDSITDVPPTDNNKPEWYYAGGELGTAYLTTANAFEQPAPAVEDAGMMQSFLNGEALFEKQFMSNNSGTRHGLGPVYIRTSCMHCHPGYGHGQRIPEGSFSPKDPGNGCLLVVYNPETNAYVNWLAGMPQSHAVAPFKAPVDESKIQVKWLNAKDGWDNTFPDGETYELQYPEVTMPKEAIYVYNQGFDGLGNYEVRLESTIGIYGTGLLDAIDEKDIVAEWVKQEKDGYMRNGLNTAFFENGQWKSFYKNTAQGNGKEYVRRFTYAMSRGPLLDGAGANAIWNITNVTRSDRRYHYLDAAGTYAEYSAKDKEVQEGFEEYIAKVDPNKEHPSWQCQRYETSTTLPYREARRYLPKSGATTATALRGQQVMIWSKILPSSRAVWQHWRCPAILSRKYGPTPTWYSTSCTWLTISARAGAAQRLSGDADCTRSVQAAQQPTACMTAVPEQRGKLSCGTDTRSRAMHTNASRNSANCPRTIATLSAPL